MPLQIGIIGLPNVGKSTIFNVLTQAQNAEVANYPFCTIEPNQAIVPLPDSRLEALAELVGVKKIIRTTIEFVDIAGLVKGASHGEGLGNKFLGTIRNTDALLHVVRCFDDPNVVHISEVPNPREDIETVQLELILSDLEQIAKKKEKLSHQIKGDKTLAGQLEMVDELQTFLEIGKPLATFPYRSNPDYQDLNHELRFLSAKPVIYAANIGEKYLSTDHPQLNTIKTLADEQCASWVQISALIESELNLLDENDRAEYMSFSGIDTSGLEKIIQTGFQTLDLISFFTYNAEEVRAWTLKRGGTAPQAAGKIHTDFERGFIKAEVIPFDVFKSLGSTTAAKEKGKLQIEGKEYQVQDGDVIYFRFNV